MLSPSQEERLHQMPPAPETETERTGGQVWVKALRRSRSDRRRACVCGQGSMGDLF